MLFFHCVVCYKCGQKRNFKYDERNSHCQFSISFRTTCTDISMMSMVITFIARLYNMYVFAFVLITICWMRGGGGGDSGGGVLFGCRPQKLQHWTAYHIQDTSHRNLCIFQSIFCLLLIIIKFSFTYILLLWINIMKKY